MIIDNKIRLIFFLHILVLIVFFFINHYILTPDDFNGGHTIKTKLDTLYHTMVTHASIGYGDISPKSSRARILATIHIFIAFLLIILIVP